MRRLGFFGQLLTVLGGLMVAAGWIAGGFPTPDGSAAGVFWAGLMLGLLGQAVAGQAGCQRELKSAPLSGIEKCSSW